MSYIRKRIKDAVQLLPEPVGRLLATVPYSWRLGQEYTSTRNDIKQFTTLTTTQQREYILRRTKRIVEHAYKNVPFYHSYYQSKGFTPEALQTFNDIKQIPIITKSDLRQRPLEDRSHEEIDRLKINTGGTSGDPLHFYVDRHAFAREWAHMHVIWESFGYNRTDLKLTMTGSKTGGAAYSYGAAHNEYIVDMYQNPAKIHDDILSLVREKQIKYIHGYPSAIYEFARYCRLEAPEIVKEFGGVLEGVLLGSEYPAPVYRDVIEGVFGVPSLSWYGHSEMAIFAPERGSPFVYEPMHTYGFCEAVSDEGGGHRLVGTSYHNTASPFIRYDTGDRVRPLEVDQGLLQAFEMTAGRVGEFVVDGGGYRVSLTALVFGRHHEIFEVAKFVQVRQNKAGEATILVTPGSVNERGEEVEWARLFDDSGVDIEFEFKVIERPIRTEEGKVKLLVGRT